jgi:hypothetical protein
MNFHNNSHLPLIILEAGDFAGAPQGFRSALKTLQQMKLCLYVCKWCHVWEYVVVCMCVRVCVYICVCILMWLYVLCEYLCGSVDFMCHF